MKNLVIEVKEFKESEINNQWDDVSNFVSEYFDLLYAGAVKLKLDIPADDYAPRRISVKAGNRVTCEGEETRLHENIGLKYANGFKYNWDHLPSEEDLEIAVKDVQMLIDAAAEPKKSSIKITITES